MLLASTQSFSSMYVVGPFVQHNGLSMTTPISQGIQPQQQPPWWDGPPIFSSFGLTHKLLQLACQPFSLFTTARSEVMTRKNWQPHNLISTLGEKWWFFSVTTCTVGALFAKQRPRCETINLTSHKWACLVDCLEPVQSKRMVWTLCLCRNQWNSFK